MQKTRHSIPVNTMDDDLGIGILIERISFKDLPNLEEWNHSERHDRHSFFLMEQGTVFMEIDFQKHTITPATIIYMHPNQVHRTIAFEDVKVSSWAISNENLNPEYLPLLEDITPAKPLALDKETFTIFSEIITTFIKISERKNDRLYHSLLKDSCNALVALAISQFLEKAKSADKLSRF